MSNPVWPASLPCPTDQSVQYQALVEPVLSTSMETGAPKRRRRFTAVPEQFSCTVYLTQDQCVALDQFVQNTLSDVLPFDWKHFRTGDPATYVFNKRPVYQLVAAGANIWQASLDLVTVP